MEKNTLDKSKNKFFVRLEVTVIAMIMVTIPVFADISNIGSNLGSWGTEQIGYIALAIIAFIALRFLIKKAWIPCGVFVVIGGTLLFIINNPEQLENIGAVIFGIATK